MYIRFLEKRWCCVLYINLWYDLFPPDLTITIQVILSVTWIFHAARKPGQTYNTSLHRCDLQNLDLSFTPRMYLFSLSGSWGRRSSQRSWSWSNSRGSTGCVREPASGKSVIAGGKVRRSAVSISSVCSLFLLCSPTLIALFLFLEERRGCILLWICGRGCSHRFLDFSAREAETCSNITPFSVKHIQEWSTRVRRCARTRTVFPPSARVQNMQKYVGLKKKTQNKP